MQLFIARLILVSFCFITTTIAALAIGPIKVLLVILLVALLVWALVIYMTHSKGAL